MKERPILFSAPMVNAILDGRKSQTRRVIKNVGADNWLKGASNHVVHATGHCPQGLAGDRLWVRESWAGGKCGDHLKPSDLSEQFYSVDMGGVWYSADNYEPRHPVSEKGRNRPSIFMPRWASRISLEITNVRVEHLHDISEEDAKNEGSISATWDGEEFYQDNIHGTKKCGFAGLWANINGTESWDSNPWFGL